MWPKFGNSSISIREVIITSSLKGFDQKNHFFEGSSWFKFNNLGLTLGTNLKFYTSVTKGLKLKVRKFSGLIPTFVEVTGEKLVGGSFCPPPPYWIGLKMNSATGIIWHGFWKVPLFNISENFLRGITIILFIQEVVTLLKMTCLELYRKDNFNCLTDNVYIWMPMPILMPM